MSKIKVGAYSISIDGYGAGPHQDLNNPLGIGGVDLHQRFFKTKTFQSMHGEGDQGLRNTDDQFAAKSFVNVGAWIMGRNMFGPIRGKWQNEEWKGWWGPNPPYHVPVFVLTHHARAPLVMEGGTTFYFITDGIESALAKAKEAAKGKDVRIGGGVATVKQYLNAGLIDEMHLAISPVVLGSGENMFSGVDLRKLGFKCTEHVGTADATHVVFKKG